MSAPPSLRKALGLETATRPVIRFNIAKASPANRPIRQTLGLREAGESRRPRFVSDTVARLYELLDPLSIGLPMHNEAQLLQAWDDQTFTPAVIRIAENLGPLIWRDAMNQRNSPSYSQLLMSKGPEPFCKTDLFWELSHHRAFIILQMEHLLFAKAMHYFRNHHFSAEQPTVKTKIVRLRMSSNIQKAREMLAKTTSTQERKRRARPQIIDVEDLEDLESFTRVPTRPKRQRRVTDVSSDEDETPNGNEIDGNNGYGRRRSERRTLEVNYNLAQSLEFLGSPFRRTPEPALTHTQMVNGGCLTPSTSPKGSNATSDNVFDRNQTQKTCTFPLTLDVPPTQTNNTQARPDTFIAAVPTTQAWSPMEQEAPSTSDNSLDLAKLRRSIARETRRELYGGETLYFSENLHEDFTRVWRADQETLRKDTGQEDYALANQAVDLWLQWRQVAAKLVKLTGIAPSASTPIPHAEYEEWIHKLGGKQEYLHILGFLQDYEAELDDNGSIDLIVSRLMRALMAATKSTSAVRALEDGLKALYEQIRLWRSALAGED